MKRLSLLLLLCLLVVVLAGLFLRPTFAHGTSITPGSCGKWSVVSSPNLKHGIAYNDLSSVAAISATDVWTVGYALVPGGQGSYTTYGMTEHWNGTNWSIVPDASPTNTELNSVAAVASNDVWAVGEVGYPVYKAFIEHWNGTAWSKVANPAPKHNLLEAVAALSSTDVWAVGSLIEHWNGTAWSIVPNPFPRNVEYSNLDAVTAVSATDIWVVGSATSTVSPDQPLIGHWDGTNWAVVSSPSIVAPGALSDVAAVSATDAWAVGIYGNGAQQSLIEHWDGTQWTIVSSPSQGGLSAVSAVSANDIWAVGSGNDGTTLIARWNGTAWSVVSSPSPSSSSNGLYGVTQIPGTTQLWAVGGYTDNNGYDKTLIEYYC